MRKFCWLLVLTGCLLAVAAGAQERNMARLTLSDTTYVDVAMGLRGEAGAFKDLYAPETRLQGVLDATSQRRLDRVHLYGHFGYGYDYGRGSTWRGWIDPYETPFMVADSIPGALSLERYPLEAGLGLPVGNWAFGLDLAYDVALMAKHKDLRNKNTAMNFRVAPGLYWNGGRFGAGLDLGYERNTEKVEYTQISESVEQLIFDVYGLWICRCSGYASAETRRMKEGDHFFADFQTDLTLGEVSLHNNFRGGFLRSVQTEVGYNNLRHGDVRSLTWSDDLLLQLGVRNQVEAGFVFSTMQGFRPLQRQELDPDSRIRTWVTYGDPVFCYWRRYHVERLRYTFGATWQLSFGIENWGMEHAYTEYPQRFVQRLSTVTPSVGLLLPLGPSWVLTSSLGFAKAYDALCEVSAWQLADPLRRQWSYWNSDRLLGEAGLRWTSASGGNYVQAGYGIEAAIPADLGVRHRASVTVGFVF